MKLIQACSTLPYTCFDFERALEGIAKAGFTHIGIWLYHAEKTVFSAEMTPAEMKTLARVMAAYNLKPYLTSMGLSASLDTEEGVRRCEREIELAGILGAPYVLGLGAYAYEHFPDKPLPADIFRQKDRNFVVAMSRLAKHAEQHQITILIKPHTGNTATARECIQTLKRISHPRVKIAYDGGNVRYYEGINPVEDVIPVAGQSECIIVKDHRGARANPEFPTPGDGEIDYAVLYRNARQHGFAGPLMVEVVRPEGESAEAVDVQIQKAKHYLDLIEQ